MPVWTALYVALFWWIFLPCVFAASLIWGDRVLRFASAFYAACLYFGHLSLGREMFRHFEHLQALSDLTLEATLLALTLRYPRWWLIAAASLQMVACLGHGAALLYHPTRLGYALMTGMGGYPILILFVAAMIDRCRSRPAPNRPRATTLREDIPLR